MLTAQDIIDLRKSLGMNRTQLGARIGVSESCVWRWENGKAHPSWDSLCELNKLADEAKDGKQPA